jgi:hypothetical protein
MCKIYNILFRLHVNLVICFVNWLSADNFNEGREHYTLAKPVE